MTNTEFRHLPVKLYFAYGSNLNKVQMRAVDDDASELVSTEYRNRCPDSIALARFILADHRLAFVGKRTGRWGPGGVATVIAAEGCEVHGALYRISLADEAALDALEGVNPADPAKGNYYKAEAAADFMGEPVMMYVATERLGAENPPSTRYLATIRQGFEMWGLPLSALDGIVPIQK